MSGQLDFLEVQINYMPIFFSSKGQTLNLPKTHEPKLRHLEQELSNRYTLLSEDIPRQLPKGSGHEVAMEALSNVTEGSKVAIIGNFLLNFLLSGSLSKFWSAINSQQIIILVTLVDVSLPANTLAFF